METISTLKKFWKIINAKSPAGGLQISDSAIQYVSVDGDALVSQGIRLSPGVMKVGRIIDRSRFIESLKTLYGLIVAAPNKKNPRVIVSLPSDLVYTQSFAVPSLEEEKISESIKLNLQMLSPVNTEGAFMGSQILAREGDRIDVLGAFSEKEKVEEIKTALIEGGFNPVLFEFPALALSRLLKDNLRDQKEAVLLLQVSSDGIDIFIYRNNSLYFDYFRSWQSIQGESREILKSVFEEVITVETQKVINFSLSRFKEAPKKAFIIAPGYESVIKDIIERNFKIPASPFYVGGYNLGSSWYVPLGSAIRLLGNYESDSSIALGIESFFNVFYEDKVLSLIRSSRNFVLGVTLSFIIIFGFSLYFLSRQAGILESKLGDIGDKSSSQGDLSSLAPKVKDFNFLVSGIGAVRGSEKPWLPFLEELKKITDANAISIETLTSSSFNSPMTLSANGPDHAAVVRFKNILAADSRFTNVDLPLSKITARNDNTVSFIITFQPKESFVAQGAR